MAGTITATTIQNDTSSPPTFRNNSVEIGTLCRAWVNFNGTGTVAIRASFNVSSITDNGTGDYTVNFTTAMPDANYSFGGYCVNPASRSLVFGDTNTYATGSLRISTAYITGFNGDSTKVDASIVNINIFR
jgi:hypothetical protein